MNAQKLPSDRLMQPRQPLAWAAGLVGAAAMIGVSMLLVSNVTVVLPDLFPAHTNVVRDIAYVGDHGAAEPTVIVTAEAPIREDYGVTDPPPAYDNTGSDGQCPAGYVAGGVDDAGNEFNCQPTGGSGGDQQCVAYNDANQCTQWYRP